MAEQDRPKSWRNEPIVALMAFVASFFLTLFVGTVILVGAAEIDPRTSARMMMLPAAIAAVLCAAITPTRRFFCRLWYFG